MRNESAVNRIANVMAAATPRKSIEVQAFTKVSPNTYKLALSADRSFSEEAIAADIAEQTGGRARLIPGAVARRGDVCVAFVAANALSKPFDQSFSMVTASTAADTSGQIWSVIDGDGGKRVVLQAGDDLDSIFQDRMNARKNHLNPVLGRGLVTASFHNGDHVLYVDTANAKTRDGIVVNVEGAWTVVGSDRVPTTVTETQVVASIPRAQLPKPLQIPLNALQANAKMDASDFAKINQFLQKDGEVKGEMESKLRELYGKSA